MQNLVKERSPSLWQPLVSAPCSEFSSHFCTTARWPFMTSLIREAYKWSSDFLATFSPWLSGLKMNNLGLVTGKLLELPGWNEGQIKRFSGLWAELDLARIRYYMIHHKPVRNLRLDGPTTMCVIMTQSWAKASTTAVRVLIRARTQAWFCNLTNSFWPRAQRRSPDQWGAMYQNNK